MCINGLPQLSECCMMDQLWKINNPNNCMAYKKSNIRGHFYLNIVPRKKMNILGNLIIQVYPNIR